MKEQRGKDASRDHEDAEPGSFHQIFRPMTPERFQHILVASTGMNHPQDRIYSGENHQFALSWNLNFASPSHAQFPSPDEPLFDEL
jgi:hypothetical protein